MEGGCRRHRRFYKRRNKREIGVMICTGGEAVPRRLHGDAREGAARKISPNVTCYQRMGKGKDRKH